MEDPLFVVWDTQAGQYVLPTREEFAQLSQFNGPRLTSERRLSRSRFSRVSLEEALKSFGSRVPWMLFTETMMEFRFRSIRGYVRALGLRSAAIFYDAIPVLRPDLCNRETRDNHAHYMRGLAGCDLILPISQYSSECLEQFWQAQQISGGTVRVNVLPGEFGGAPREVQMPGDTDQIRILCVSTLEPRKNHRNLIEACLLLERDYPELDWTLSLVGNQYAGALEIATWVREVCASNPRIRWEGVVDDQRLHEFYAAATFTVYPSVMEGFGMPILESIWHGRPCVCSSGGVMGELAREGGCLTADVNDVRALSAAISQLARNRDLREQLAGQAIGRPLKVWRDYVKEFLAALESTPCEQDVLPIHVEDAPLFDAEELALRGLLSRCKPHCSVVVGNSCGAGLRLVAQHSDIVFAVDRKPAEGSHISNVTFLSGEASEVLPVIFQELDNAKLAVDFILLDAGEPPEAVRGTVREIMRYIPPKRLLVILRDSFHPELRLAIAESQSPYCHWVELDFVPGHASEGGMAIACFQPFPREGPVFIHRSADTLFQSAASNTAAAV
jgi:glycosyltransferase involved in cell wall biosynthesis